MNDAAIPNEDHFPDNAEEAVHGIVWEYLNNYVMTMKDAVGAVADAELRDEIQGEARWFATVSTMLLDDEFFIDDEAEELVDLVDYTLRLAGLDAEGDPH